MTDINVQSTAPVESTEVVEPIEGSEVETSEVSGADDPNESFSDWLKRTEGGKKTGKDPKQGDKLNATPDVSSEVSKALEGDKSAITDNNTDLKSAENDNIRVLKVGDKKFKAEDVAKLDKDFSEVSTKLEHQTQENQKMIADVEKFVDTLRKNPGEILDRFKISQDQIEQYLWDKHYKFKNETPVDKAARLEKELNDIRTKSEQEVMTKRQQEQQQAQHNYRMGKIQEGLTAQGLPENQYTVQRMNGYIDQMIQKGLNISMGDLAAYVKQDYEAAQAESLKNMSPEQVAKVLGKDTMDKVRRSEVDKLKQDKFKNTNPGQGKIKREDTTKKKVYKSPYDLLDDL